MFYVSFKRRLSTYLTLLLGVCGVWFCYTLISYHHTQTVIHNDQAHLLNDARLEVQEAMDQFYQFLNLTEARVLRAFKNDKRIVPILSSRLETYLDKKFPHIMTLSLTLTSKPNVLYSRLGKTFQKRAGTLACREQEVVYLRKGNFKLKKPLFDHKKKCVGTLETIFSLSSFLVRNDLHIVPFHKQGLVPEDLFFKIRGLPYVFFLDASPPSFKDFLGAKKVQLIFVFVYGFLLVCLVYMLSRLSSAKSLRHFRTQIQTLKRSLRTLQEKKDRLEMGFNKTQQLLTLKKDAEKDYDYLWRQLQERYSLMVGQVQAMLQLAEQQILESLGPNQQKIKDIKPTFQESGIILRRLAKGLPMKGREEDGDILESLERIRRLFLSSCVEKQIQVEMEDTREEKELLFTDKVILELVLYNIFYLLFERFSKQNTLKIAINRSDPLEITFSDNGYVLKNDHKAPLQIDTFSGNPLCLGRQLLQDLINFLGWSLIFQIETGGLNTIKLIIPQSIKPEELPSNVVGLFHPSA